MEGCREILDDRCPAPYTVGVLRHIPPAPAPVCGEDFCEVCGDCMACNGDFPCFDGAPHVWRS